MTDTRAVEPYLTVGSSVIITFAYDTLNRLKTKTPPSGPVVSYSYDLAGRTTSISAAIAAFAAVSTGAITKFGYLPYGGSAAAALLIWFIRIEAERGTVRDELLGRR